MTILYIILGRCSATHQMHEGAWGIRVEVCNEKDRRSSFGNIVGKSSDVRPELAQCFGI